MTRLIKPENVNKTVTLKGVISEYPKPEPIISKAIFECKNCMKKIEIQQKTRTIKHPAVCTECGGSKFKLLIGESDYSEIQILTLHTKEEFIPLKLYGSYLCSNEIDSYAVRGILKVKLNEQRNKYYLDVTQIVKN